MASTRERRNRAIVRRLRKALREIENDADLEPTVEPTNMTNARLKEFLRRRVKHAQSVLREIISSSDEMLESGQVAVRAEADRELARGLGGELENFEPENEELQEDKGRDFELAEQAGMELREDVPDNYERSQIRRLLAFIEDAINYANDIPVPTHIIKQPDGFYRVIVDYEP